MANKVQLTDGTTTVDFLGSTYPLSEGGLTIPPFVKESTVRPIRPHGVALLGYAFRSREVTITFGIIGTDGATLGTSIQTIQALLEKAKRYASLGQYATSRVRLLYRIGNAAADTDYDVLDGDLELPTDFQSIRLNRSFRIRPATLRLACRPFAKSGESNAISPAVSIANRSDGSGNNHTDIAAATAAGDLPGPLRIRVKNTLAGSALGQLWLAVRSMGTPGNVNHVLDAEPTGGDGVLVGNGETDTVDAACNNGRRVRIIATQATTWQSHITFTISTNPIDYYGLWRVLARIRTDAAAVTDLRLRLRNGDDVGTYVVTTDYVNPEYVGAAWHLLDLGLIRIPALQYPVTGSQSNFKLDLQSYHPDTAKYLDVDYLLLLPASEGICLIRTPGCAQNQSIVLDAIGAWDGQEIVYKLTTAAQVMMEGGVEKVGYGLWLTPGRLNRLYVVGSRASNNDVVGDTYDVSAEMIANYGTVA